MRTTKEQREVIRQAKITTARFRDALRSINPAIGHIAEISQEEFIARRNRIGSSKYRFHSVPKKSNPLTKSEIKDVFRRNN